MHPRLKKIIFDKLYEDLKHVEIIPYKESIWFIDREKKYWYLEYEKPGYLWWKYDFFTNFFRLFSMDKSEYERVIADWVEEVLNFKVDSTKNYHSGRTYKVEEVLNFKIGTTNGILGDPDAMVEEVLNFKVGTTNGCTYNIYWVVEEILNSKVKTTFSNSVMYPITEEEVLNFKVDTTKKKGNWLLNWAEKVLNSFRVN